MTEVADHACTPALYLSGDDYVNGITAQQRLLLDGEADAFPFREVGFHDDFFEADRYDQSEYYDDFYCAHYDDEFDDPTSDQQDSELDDLYDGWDAYLDRLEEAESADVRCPSHGSSRMLPSDVRGNARKAYKKSDRDCWKRKRGKQWQHDRYRWVGPQSIKRLQLVEQRHSLLDLIADSTVLAEEDLAELRAFYHEALEIEACSDGF